MSIPKHDELYKELLLSLTDGEAHTNAEIRDFVAKEKGVSDEERSILLQSGKIAMFDDRVGWARTYLKAAGLVMYPKRGLTQITDEGRKVLAENPQPFDTPLLRRYESFLAFERPNKDKQNDVTELPSQDQTPQETMDLAFSFINSSLGDELLSEIMSREPRFFESLVVKLLVRMGYGGALEDAGTVTPLSGDEGIDGIIREDKLGFSNIYIQAKRYALDNSVSRPEVQGFIGAIANKAGKGLFITTGKFTEGAKQCAKENHIVLVDGRKLADLMIEYGVGVSTTQVYEIKKLDSDFFSE